MRELELLDTQAHLFTLRANLALVVQCQELLQPQQKRVVSLVEVVAQEAQLLQEVVVSLGAN